MLNIHKKSTIMYWTDCKLTALDLGCGWGFHYFMHQNVQIVNHICIQQ